MADLPVPHVIHLGKKSKKDIKKFKKGHGSMHYEVQSVIARAKEQLADSGKEPLPVVVTHSKKKKNPWMDKNGNHALMGIAHGLHLVHHRGHVARGLGNLIGGRRRGRR